MPPEQANGRIEEMDRRSDVFGLGAILCEILTLEPPHVGPTLKDVMRQAREADLAGAYARLEACGADAELVALARACLSAKPNDRPEDASVVEKRLTDYLASVQERLRQAELNRAAAQARADEEERTRRVAEKMVEGERRERELAEEARRLSEKARRRLLWLTAGLACALLALVAASFFAWQAHQAKGARLAAEQAREAENRQHAIDRALMAVMGGDLEGAEETIAEAELAGASTGHVRMLRGQLALHRGQSGEAMRHLEQAVRLLPSSVAVRGMLAAAYASDGDWERYDRTIREMARLTPSTAEDFLFKGYAEGNLDPELGLQTIQKAFELRPRMLLARLLRSEIRAYRAQDTDDLAEAEGAVQDAGFARELLGDKNPTALWVSLGAHLAKAGVHEHRAELDQTRAEAELDQRRAELELAGKDADALNPFTAFPEAVVYRWLYFREVGKAEEVLGELRQASENTGHVYVAVCYALTLYRRGRPGDLKEALRVLEIRRGKYIDRLLPFVLAEHDYPNKHGWPARALEAARTLRHTQAVLCLLGKKEGAVKANKALLSQRQGGYLLRDNAELRCLRYNAGELTAAELIQGAGRSRWDQCLAHYYVAMTKLAEGDRKGAQEHFDKVIKTRAFLWGAYDISWVFRAQLAKDPTWPPWISKGRAK
jgi:tetratricopeptide (TPR) repeat protein